MSTSYGSARVNGASGAESSAALVVPYPQAFVDVFDRTISATNHGSAGGYVLSDFSYGGGGGNPIYWGCCDGWLFPGVLSQPQTTHFLTVAGVKVPWGVSTSKHQWRSLSFIDPDEGLGGGGTRISPQAGVSGGVGFAGGKSDALYNVNMEVASTFATPRFALDWPSWLHSSEGLSTSPVGVIGAAGGLGLLQNHDGYNASAVDYEFTVDFRMVQDLTSSFSQGYFGPRWHKHQVTWNSDHTLDIRSGGSNELITNAATWSAGQWFRINAKQEWNSNGSSGSGRERVKIWAVGDAEPAWQIDNNYFGAAPIISLIGPVVLFNNSGYYTPYNYSNLVRIEVANMYVQPTRSDFGLMDEIATPLGSDRYKLSIPVSVMGGVTGSFLVFVDGTSLDGYQGTSPGANAAWIDATHTVVTLDRSWAGYWSSDGRSTALQGLGASPEVRVFYYAARS